MNQEEFGTLNGYLSQYEQKTSNQIFVAIIPSLEGLPIEDYSIRLAEKWKVGKKGKDNGVLLLIAINDHKMRIEVGYGLEPKLTDIASGQIIRDGIAPFFRQNRYRDGILAGLEAITAKIDGQPFQGTGIPAIPSQSQSGSGFLVLLLALAIIFFVIFRMFGGFLPLILFSGGPNWRSGGSNSWGGGGFGGGGFSGGGGGSFGGGGASGGW